MLLLLGITSASINAMTAPADNTAIANLKLVLQNHVIGLGTRSNDFSSLFKTWLLKATPTSTSGVI
jgi:uncharacterized oligopeptide transporter (OPT) family protein